MALQGIPGAAPALWAGSPRRSSGAPVLVVEGEKTAEAAAVRFPDYVVATSPGGSGAAAKRTGHLSGRDVVIWPDADEPGKRYAQDDVGYCGAPGRLRSHGALAGRLPVAGTWRTRCRTVSSTRICLGCWLKRLRLAPISRYRCFRPCRRPSPIPSRLSARCCRGRRRDLSQGAGAGGHRCAIGARRGGAGGSGHADVLLPYGQTRPLSLYLVTVAASGDRKSTADNEALWPVRKREKALKEQHDLRTKLVDRAGGVERREEEDRGRQEVQSRDPQARVGSARA